MFQTTFARFSNICMKMVRAWAQQTPCLSMQMPADWSEVIAAVAARTVHVALLPYDTTIDKLGTYFSKHGEVNQVRLLKYSDSDGAGAFRGTALIEMSSREEANILISNNLEYQGAILRLQSKAGYEEMQAQVWRRYLLMVLLKHCVRSNLRCTC